MKEMYRIIKKTQRLCLCKDKKHAFCAVLINFEANLYINDNN